MSKQSETAAVTVPARGIPFAKLIADPKNVRKTRTGDSLAALADNIEAEGLLRQRPISLHVEYESCGV